MSKAFKNVTLIEFGFLLEYARKYHLGRNEEIPQLAKQNWDNIAFALQAPSQWAGGRPAYRGFLRKASVLFYLIAKGHRLSNGNKRMACVTLNHYCFINKRKLVISDEGLLILARYTASSDAMEKDQCIENIEAILKRAIQKK